MNFKEFQTEQKLRGGYYTPADLAEFLVRWVGGKNPRDILEPSCGDGVFLKSVADLIPAANVTGFEIDAAEAKKASKAAREAGLNEFDIWADDFLGWAVDALPGQSGLFDAVLGNPPFIRYQYLPPLFQERAEIIFSALGCKFTKHTNAWVPFILASFALLRPGGRLAMVVPAEIIHVTHAQSLRSYLGENASRLVVIDPEELWFPGTLQGAVLLLVEKKENPRARAEGLGMYPVKGRGFLNSDPEEIFRAPKSINGKTVEGKWTRALLDPSTRSLVDGLIDAGVARRFDEVAEVDVGIVTGANKFFLVEDETVEQFGLQEWAHPMFGRSEHCPGVVYDECQHRANATKGNPTNFIWFQDRSVEKSRRGKRYIEQGERENLHTRYKCRIRSPWYSVPSVYATEIGMLKRSHDTPRLILNELRAYTTDTAYRIRLKEGKAEQLVYGFINGLTALSAELEGRHYGGGVLELVPSEIEKLLVPPPLMVKPKIAELDRAVRTMPMDAVLEQQTRHTLGNMGLSKVDQAQLLGGWKKLRDRRHRVSADAD
ncbi:MULTISPECIES: Eco57I restriction-modification methylase domain-containing protein [unclassified Brucella]|uniref:Eco57I restriction-modification methylase domain-containing protein n=1 Tax=unclassified Brucella TaxID=2632610 RepID=UPI00129797CF|nr:MULTISPECIES: N-6 DNA methylase [unclassified Brucella]QGA58494.1 N-6 DNA methylase [Brucella sp. 2280]UWF68175.1 N-6 DNA methylase [Brucella sp. 1315]UWF71292.1 N-6 DNA methylase [Brucella sp. 2594]